MPCVVAPVRGDGIVHVHDGGHAAQLGDLLGLLPVGIARAREPLMVLPADLHDGGGNARSLLEDVQPQGHMALHDVELGVRQLAGLVEDVVRHPHLADVVEHAAHARFLDHLLAHVHVAAERHQERADAHRMLERVGVRLLDPAEAHQGALVAQDRLRDLTHHRRDPLHLDLLAQPDIGKDAGDDLGGLALDLLGDLQLLPVRGLGCGAMGAGDGLVDPPLDLFADLLLGGPYASSPFSVSM